MPPPPLPEPRGRRRSRRRAPARIGALLALAAVVAAVVALTTSTLRPAPTSSTATTRTTLKISYHHVRPGDSLSSIAARYHSTVAILMSLNPHLVPQYLRAGQVLRVGTPQ
jgi:LysM repeat protein